MHIKLSDCNLTTLTGNYFINANLMHLYVFYSVLFYQLTKNKAK